MMSGEMKDSTYHPEEIDNASKENRPVLLSRLFRYDHLRHSIPLGSLVEVDICQKGYDANGMNLNLSGICVLYVVGHHRDCDGTPLYMVSDLPIKYPSKGLLSEEYKAYKLFCKYMGSGYEEDGLKATGKVVTLYGSIQEMLR